MLKTNNTLYYLDLSGVLFLLYIILLVIVAAQYKWGFKKIMLAFIASLIPFGTFETISIIIGTFSTMATTIVFRITVLYISTIANIILQVDYVIER